MHIPDGYLDPAVSLAAYVVALAAVALSARSYFGPGGEGEGGGRDRVYDLAVMAAAIFAAQMLNWPIPGGTSAHLVGGALAAAVLGPAGGCLAVTLNLVIQCLVMGDGGITALGANVLNMAVVDVFLGYWIYRALGGPSSRRDAAAFAGGWLGIAAAAAACGVELGLSPQFGYPLSITVPVMLGWHLALGVIEGLITAFVVRYLAERAPNMLYGYGG